MVFSILIAVLSVAMLAFWFRFSHRLLSREAQPGETYARSYERAPIRSAGTVNWSSSEGGALAMAIKGVNLSKGGALVEAKEPLAPGGVVLVHFETLHVMTTATVRRCIAAGSAYRIGLEFRHPLMVAERGTWTVIVQPATEVAV
jgi:PilZ domain